MISKYKLIIFKTFQIIETILTISVLILVFIQSFACRWLILMLSIISIAVNIHLNIHDDFIHQSILWKMIYSVQMCLFLLLNYYFRVLSSYSVVSILLEFILFCSALLCYYGGFIKKWKPETLFLIIAIPYGIFMNFSLPVKSAPDEIAHIYTSYQLADQFLSLDKENGNVFSIREQDQVFLNAPVEYGNSAELMDDIYNASRAASYGDFLEQNTDVCLNGNRIAYVLSATGIATGILLNWNAFWTLNFGRILNLMQYILLVYFAIKLIPSVKYLPATVSLLPVSIQQGMSYSYDSLVIGLSVFIICCAYGLKDNRVSGKKRIIFVLVEVIACFILTLLKNHSYIFVSIIPLIIMFSENIVFQRMMKWIVKMFVLSGLLFTVYMLLDLIFKIDPVFTEPVNPIAWQDGVQGYTIQYFLNEPLDLVVVYLRTLIVYAQFYIRSSISDYLSWLNIRTSFLYVPLFLLMCLAAVRSEATKYVNKYEKRYFALSSLITILAIIMALLISWTPVGTGVTLGVQGRYFIPLFVPIFLIFCFKKERGYGCEKYIPSVYSLTLMIFSFTLITRF